MTEEQITLTNDLKNRLMVLRTEPVTATHPKGIKQHMDWIVGTTKYLSNLKKIIYDVSFLRLYMHDNKIPEACLAIDNFLYKVDQWAHLDFPERFKEILDKEGPKVHGARIYLDDILYADNIPFKHFENIRNYLLRERTDGAIWFDVMKCVDPAGNVSLFLPSKATIKMHKESLKTTANVIKEKRPVKREARN